MVCFGDNLMGACYSAVTVYYAAVVTGRHGPYGDAQNVVCKCPSH